MREGTHVRAIIDIQIAGAPGGRIKKGSEGTVTANAIDPLREGLQVMWDGNLHIIVSCKAVERIRGVI